MSNIVARCGDKDHFLPMPDDIIWTKLRGGGRNEVGAVNEEEAGRGPPQGLVERAHALGRGE